MIWRRISGYCESGRPLVGVRTASHAIQTWLELDKLVLGGDYQGHYGQGPQTKITLTDAGRKHPIPSGFEPFESTGSLYKNPHLADNAQVLLSGGIVDAEGTAHSEPIAWVRDSPQRRSFTPRWAIPTISPAVVSPIARPGAVLDRAGMSKPSRQGREEVKRKDSDGYVNLNCKILN